MTAEKAPALRAVVEGERIEVRAPASPFRFTLFRDIELEPRKTWLIHDFLGAGELSCIFGPPGSGKSVLAGDLAAHVASEREWLGRPVKFGSVLYVAIERAALVMRRFAAFRNHHGVEEAPLALLSGHIDLRTSTDGANAIIEHAKRLADLAEIETSLVAIDTVSRALAGGDENSPKDMGALVANLARIQEATGAHVSALHHIPADGTQRLRGHGALLGACDTTIKVERVGQCRAAAVDKVNDGPEGERVTFDLQSVELHHDTETGTITTAPVVIPAEQSAAMEPAGPRLTPNQETMLAVLKSTKRPLSTEEWTRAARDAGLGGKRKAWAWDLRNGLKHKGLVYEGINGWSAN